MTAGDIYRQALAYLYDVEGRDPDFQQFFPAFLNALLLEALPCQNSRRRAAGLAPIEAPQVSGPEEELPYDDELCRLALPYGLAAYYFSDEGEGGTAANYRARFVSALDDLSKAAACEMADAY